MIIALSIRDFVLIDRLDLEPRIGFTALTGETGAGKSIILDALGVALGGAAERRFVRAGCEQASVSVAFAVGEDHAIWPRLEEAGVGASTDEAVTLKRVIRTNGPARAFINDQPVSVVLLADIGEYLVEIHGQHAASALLRPSRHRALLDQFAGNGDLLGACSRAWARWDEAREAAASLRVALADGEAERADLAAALAELDELAPVAGEATRLAAQRTRLMQTERVAAQLAEAGEALESGDIVTILGKAARALEQISRLPGYDDTSSGPGAEARAAADALERGVIEVQEGERAIDALAARAIEDPESLEAAEARLFALRAAARKHGVEPDALEGVRARLAERLDQMDNSDEALRKADAAEREARARWHGAAERLTAARTASAGRLEKAVKKELRPLKLERTGFRVAFAPIADGQTGASGAETVEFEIETNAGAGFGALRQIASGGELARLSLALKCALAGTGKAGVLIFDEADQGVGGAVAAAIGERLAQLGEDRQVLAITHSPQVAAAGQGQWSIAKTAPRKGLGRTAVTGLDEAARLEEIARMLAGAKVTPEARAAARRLLEEKCQVRAA